MECGPSAVGLQEESEAQGHLRVVHLCPQMPKHVVPNSNILPSSVKQKPSKLTIQVRLILHSLHGVREGEHGVREGEHGVREGEHG